MKVQGSRSSIVPVVTAAGERLVSHAGVGMLAEVADLSGLTAGLTGLFARQGLRWRRHAPGVTLARAAAAIADGMVNVSEVGLFCSSRRAVFAQPAARSTLRRVIFALGGELMTPGLDRVLAAARARTWQAARYAPAALTIDVDATLLECHFRQGTGGAELQVRVRLPPPRHVAGRDPRAVGDAVTPRKRGL